MAIAAHKLAATQALIEELLKLRAADTTSAYGWVTKNLTPLMAANAALKTSLANLPDVEVTA